MRAAMDKQAEDTRSVLELIAGLDEAYGLPRSTDGGGARGGGGGPSSGNGGAAGRGNRGSGGDSAALVGTRCAEPDTRYDARGAKEHAGKVVGCGVEPSTGTIGSGGGSGALVGRRSAEPDTRYGARDAEEHAAKVARYEPSTGAIGGGGWYGVPAGADGVDGASGIVGARSSDGVSGHGGAVEPDVHYDTCDTEDHAGKVVGYGVEASTDTIGGGGWYGVPVAGGDNARVGGPSSGNGGAAGRGNSGSGGGSGALVGRRSAEPDTRYGARDAEEHAAKVARYEPSTGAIGGGGWYGVPAGADGVDGASGVVGARSNDGVSGKGDAVEPDVHYDSRGTDDHAVKGVRYESSTGAIGGCASYDSGNRADGDDQVDGGHPGGDGACGGALSSLTESDDCDALYIDDQVVKTPPLLSFSPVSTTTYGDTRSTMPTDSRSEASSDYDNSSDTPVRYSSSGESSRGFSPTDVMAWSDTDIDVIMLGSDDDTPPHGEPATPPHNVQPASTQAAGGQLVTDQEGGDQPGVAQSPQNTTSSVDHVPVADPVSPVYDPPVYDNTARYDGSGPPAEYDPTSPTYDNVEIGSAQSSIHGEPSYEDLQSYNYQDPISPTHEQGNRQELGSPDVDNTIDVSTGNSTIDLTLDD